MVQDPPLYAALSTLTQRLATELPRSHEQSWRDPLMGLPNRLSLRHRLQDVGRRAKLRRSRTAVLFVDLDNFSRVNHQYGHAVGDELLLAVADRLSGIVRTGDTLVRIGGDEFVFLCEDMQGETDADELAGRVHAAFDLPFRLAGIEIRMSASVGLAIAGPGDHMCDQLVISADTAMRQAKRKGGNAHQFVDQEEATLLSNRHSLEVDVREAFAAGAFHLEYQPIVRCEDGVTTGVEALLRWTDPDRGAVPPDLIVAIAEQSALVNDLGAWVLERACADHCEWLRRYPGRPLDLAVNVSGRQLMAPAFSDVVARMLATTGMNPTALVLEITEQTLIEDIDRVTAVLAELKRLGVRLALDDFGTGYSSLGYLRRLPIDVLKIDQSFIADLGCGSETASVIVATVTDLAHRLGMRVTAEGVETSWQRDAVQSIGCDEAQGYFHARPMPAAAIRAHLRRSPVPTPEARAKASSC